MSNTKSKIVFTANNKVVTITKVLENFRYVSALGN